MMNVIMVTFTSSPFNAYTWTWGGIAVYAFMIKSILSYRRTRNPIARIYIWLGLTFGTGLLFYGLPGLLTDNISILHYTYFVADIGVQLSLQFAVWLMWFLGMRLYVSLKYLLAVSLSLSFAIMIIEVMTSKVSISQSPHLIVYQDKLPVLILKSIIYVLVALPVGYFLLRQVPNQATAKAKIQSFISGLLFIIVCLAATSNNIFDKGSDTISSSTDLAIFFAVFLLAQLPRPHRFS